MTDYHWSHLSIRRFLEELACTGIVSEAAKAANMTPRSAYNLRAKREGIAFRYAWDAAMLVARAAVEGALMERALLGESATITSDADSGTRVRHHHNHRLGMALLTRLDRRCDAALQSADHAIVRAAAQDFDCFIELASHCAGLREIGQFAARFIAEDDVEIHRELAQISHVFEPETEDDDEDYEEDDHRPHPGNGADAEPTAHKPFPLTGTPEYEAAFLKEHPL